MASSPRRDALRLGATLASGLTLAASGAAMTLAWQAGMWASLAGAAFVVGWTLGLGCRSALRSDPPAVISGGAVEPGAMSLLALLDRVPLPLVRTDGAQARAINRAARQLFATDDRILPVPAALSGPAHRRLRHGGRAWRLDAVEGGRADRLIVLIDSEEEETAAEDRAGDEMIEILGHELLNGLSPIVSLADSAVTAAAQGDDELPDILATLARRVEGLESFTRAYRALARLPDPIHTPVALDQLAGDLARLFAGRFGGTVELTLNVPPAPPAMVDRDQLTQAIWALLQNGAEAALAAAAPRRVALALMAADGALTIAVSDTGDGITSPERSRIFRPFHTTKPGGSGIGLSLARRIARMHNGELSLLPTMPTTFELTTPAHPDLPSRLFATGRSRS